MQYLFTERAHLMCPNMCFGIVLSADRPYEEERVRLCVEQLSAAHPFLNALLGYEEAGNAYYYDITAGSKVELFLKNQSIESQDADEIMDEYQRLTGYDWDLLEEGMLKIAVWPMGKQTCFLLTFHHLLTDGRGALGLAQELADCYVHDVQPKYAEETLISSPDEFPKDSRMPFISRFLVGRANKTWRKEQKTLSWQEYHAFADEFLKTDKVRHIKQSVSSEELEEIRDGCHERQVTVNDYLLAKMMMEEDTGKAIIACDLRDRLSCYREGAMGNYSTAFSVEIRKREKEIWNLAKQVHDEVRRKMERPSDLYLVLQCYASLDPGALDAAFISCRGNFPSKAGEFIGSMFFGFGAADGYSVTNLGRVESKSMISAYFIPPASPAVLKTQGILTVNNQMTVCTSER